MKLGMCRVYLATFALLSFNGFAQQQLPGDSERSTYLFRIERLWARRDVCMLVNRDGAYRLEKIFSDKTEVSVGTLSELSLQNLTDLLNAESLQRLTQDDIGHPITGTAVNHLSLSIG